MIEYASCYRFVKGRCHGFFSTRMCVSSCSSMTSSSTRDRCYRCGRIELYVKEYCATHLDIRHFLTSNEWQWCIFVRP